VSPRTRLDIESATARQYVGEQTTARDARASTGDERRIAAALHRAADAAETALLELDGAAV
jgi:hypothetical protein